MKTAKIMFTVLAPLAIVGGLLAFKTNAVQVGNVYCLSNGAQACTTATYTLTPNGNLITTSLPCPDLVNIGQFISTYYTDGLCATPPQGGYVYDNNN